MATLPSVKTKLTVEAVQYRSLVSEFLAQTMGRSINYLIDAVNGQTVSQVLSIAITSGQSYSLPAGYTFTGVRIIATSSVSDGGAVFYTLTDAVPYTVTGATTLTTNSTNPRTIVGTAVKNITLGS